MEGGRVQGVIIDKPFIVGSAAFRLNAEEKEGDNTHRWSVYVRGVGNSDISYYVRQVNFLLHQTIANPLRQITRPPFQVTDVKGWGEFVIQVEIFFHDPAESSVKLSHPLKLYPSSHAVSKRKPVISEMYDQFMFVTPTQGFLTALEAQDTKVTAHWLTQLGETAVAQRLHNLPPYDPQANPLTQYWNDQRFADEESRDLTALDSMRAEMLKKTDALRRQLHTIETDGR